MTALGPEVVEVPPRFLIESLVRRDGTVDLGHAYATAAALGIADQTLRLALRRTVADGSFVQEGRGRRGILRRTTSADLLEGHDVELVRFAYAQDQGEAPWDGRWRLLALSVPEEHRPVRDLARRTLLRLGAGHVQTGVYLTPHDLAHLLETECPDLRRVGTLVQATTEELAVGEHTAPRAIAAAVWDLDTIAERHTILARVAAAASASAHALDDPGRTAAALALAWAFDQAHVPDPLLPPGLLPEDWVGARARAAFAAAWAELAAQAPREQLALFERYA